MKKIALLILSTALCLSALASEKKSWNFTNNDEGECVINYTIPTSKDQVAAIKATKVAINKLTLNTRQLTASTDSTLTYHLVKNTKVRYNPFAGNFTEDMSINLFVSYSNGNINLYITEPTVICSYSGYGSNTTSKSFATRIDEYYSNEEKINNKETKKKERKALLDEQENINSELNMCQEELNKIIESIKSSIK
jgi:hypothetical protein